MGADHNCLLSFPEISPVLYLLPFGAAFSKLLLNYNMKRAAPEDGIFVLASPVFRLYPAMPFRRFRHRFSAQPSLNHTTVGIEAACTEQAYDKPADDFFHEYLPPYFFDCCPV